MRDTAIQRITERPEKRKPEKVSVTIRVPSDIVEALKAEAESLDMGYQPLWVLYTRKQLEAIGRLEVEEES